MKNILVVAVMVVLAFSSMAGAELNPYMDRIGFFTSGDNMVYVKFPFTVPYGECGQVDTYLFVPGNITFNDPAYWEKLDPGTEAYPGIYWFHNPSEEVDCYPDFQIEGRPSDMDAYGMWTGHVVSAYDIGVLTAAKIWTNSFSLPTDGSQQYSLVFNRYGYKITIGALMRYADCDLSGVVLPHQWGFLGTLISWSGTMEENAKMVKDIVINRDEVFVAICRNN